MTHGVMQVNRCPDCSCCRCLSRFIHNEQWMIHRKYCSNEHHCQHLQRINIDINVSESVIPNPAVVSLLPEPLLLHLSTMYSVPNILFFRSQKLVIFWLQRCVCSRDAVRSNGFEWAYLYDDFSAQKFEGFLGAPKNTCKNWGVGANVKCMPLYAPPRDVKMTAPLWQC